MSFPKRSRRLVFQRTLPSISKAARLPLLKYVKMAVPSVVGDGLLPDPLRFFPARSGPTGVCQREEREVTIQFDSREVIYDFGELDEVSLAYAISIHKAQGSEFPVVIAPVAMQHYMLLQRNLIYTAITRGRKMVVLVGQKKALGLAVRNNRTSERFSGLLDRLRRSAEGRSTALLP